MPGMSGAPQAPLQANVPLLLTLQNATPILICSFPVVNVMLVYPLAPICGPPDVYMSLAAMTLIASLHSPLQMITLTLLVLLYPLILLTFLSAFVSPSRLPKYGFSTQANMEATTTAHTTMSLFLAGPPLMLTYGTPVMTITSAGLPSSNISGLTALLPLGVLPLNPAIIFQNTLQNA